MKNFKSKREAGRSKKAHVCHTCGGLKGRELTSSRKKPTRLVVGGYFGQRWFPNLTRTSRSS